MSHALRCRAFGCEKHAAVSSANGSIFCADHSIDGDEPIVSPRLSNAELADAITWALEALEGIMESEREHAPTLAHYEALLAEQRRRAGAAP